MNTLVHLFCICCSVASYLLISYLQYMYITDANMYAWFGLQFTAGVANGYVIGTSLARLIDSN